MLEWIVTINGNMTRYEDYFNNELPVMLKEIKIFVRAKSLKEASEIADAYMAKFDDDYTIITIDRFWGF